MVECYMRNVYCVYTYGLPGTFCIYYIWCNFFTPFDTFEPREIYDKQWNAHDPFNGNENWDRNRFKRHGMLVSKIIKI